jgi:UDP-N-acetylmuramoylalanine--D-glutamate ligase
VSKALEAFRDRPLVVLLGGRNKGNDFRSLAARAAEVAHVVVAFGEAREEIAAAFQGVDLTPEVVSTLAEAVAVAAGRARAGDAVVLSPGCASFDEFDNYEERGRAFKSMVFELGKRVEW